MTSKRIDGVLDCLMIPVAHRSREFARALTEQAYRQGVEDSARFLEEVYQGKHGGSAYGLADRVRRRPNAVDGEKPD